MKAKKSLGQNFLIDETIINNIVEQINANEDDLIIEIGPGRGALTKMLIGKKSHYIGYEIDNELIPILKKFVGNKIVIKNQDFLTSDLTNDIRNISYNKLFIVGNLPYYITTPIIEHIINSKIKFEKLVIMVQKEVADRFMASCGAKDYGYMTLYLKYYFDIFKVCDVSKFSFNPVPKVESSVLSFSIRKNRPIVDENKYFEFLKACFKQKRKTLKNNIGNIKFEKIKKILLKNNIMENVRAEEINEELFILLFNELNKNN